MLRLHAFVVPSLVTVAAALGGKGRDELELIRSNSSEAQFEALCNEQADLAVTSMDNVIAWNRRPGPADFRIVAQIELTTPLHLLARPGIERIDEMRGHIALVDALENGFVIALRSLFLDAGLLAADYTMLPVGGVKERLDALRSGQGDCTLLGPPFTEMALQEGFVQLANVQQRYPVFPGQGLVCRISRIEQLKCKMAPWLNGLVRAAKVMSENQPAAEHALIKVGQLPIPISSIANLAPRSLVPDRPGVELLIAMRKRLGLEGSDETYQTLVDTSLLVST